VPSSGSIGTRKNASPTLHYIHKSPSRHSQYMDWSSAWMVQGSNPGGEKRFLSSPKRPDRLWGPPSLIFSRYRGSFPGVKQPGSLFNHSLPFSVEVKSEWSYTTTPPIRLHAVDSYSGFFFNLKAIKSAQNTLLIAGHVLSLAVSYGARSIAQHVLLNNTIN
jgi:hypothetical protein